MKRPIESTVVASVVVMESAMCAGQSCEQKWLASHALPGIAGRVSATTRWDPDGEGPEPELLAVGGEFETAGDAIASGVAVWDGVTWRGVGAGIRGPVRALAVYDGQLVAAGSFHDVGGTNGDNIVRWTGTVWRPMGSGITTDDYFAWVHSLTVYGGELIAAGEFTTAGGVAAANIARWDGAVWRALDGGITAGADHTFVNALTVFNGELVAAGDFTTAGGVAVNNIARWNGASWQPLGDGADAHVQALTTWNGDLIAGGYFNNAGGIAAHRIARWDGSTWFAIDNSLESEPGTASIRALTVHQGDLFVAGSFSTAGGHTARDIARWNGASWEPLGEGISGEFSPRLNTVTSYGGELIAGGDFSSAGRATAVNIARWDGASWHALSQGSGLNGFVNALTVFEGQLIAGGVLTSAGGAVVQDVARWDGVAWRPFGARLNNELHFGFVSALTVHDNQLIAAGFWFNEDRTKYHLISRWNGEAWESLGTSMTGYVNALATFDGLLIAAGSFTTLDDVSASRVAAWDGSNWRALEEGVNGEVNALTVFDRQLFAGGSFTVAGTSNANRIARWDGTNWSALGGPIDGMNYNVLSLGVYNGELVAGGQFTLAGGAVANKIARWNGANWQPFGAGFNNAVAAIAVYNGQLIACGYMEAWEDAIFDHIARWDGAAWLPLDTGANWFVGALTVYGRELVAAGEFTITGSRASSGWARWGTTTQMGDFDFDGIIDLADFASIPDCLSGPTAVTNAPASPAECLCALNGDGDADTDLADVRGFQNAFAP